MFIGSDESGIAPQYEVIGSIWLPNEDVIEFERRVTEWRVGCHFWEEIHFDQIKGKSTDFSVDNYLRFLQIGFEIGVQFKCIVVKKSLTDLALHDDNERIRQLNFLALLIRNKLKTDFPDTKGEINIVSDNFIPKHVEIKRSELTTTSNPDGGLTFQTEERRYVAIPHAKERIEKEIGRKIDCFAQCVSHLCSVLQLADLFAGSVASRLGEEPVNANRDKIISSFETHFKHPFSARTSPLRKDLNIWIWRPPAEISF